VVSNSCLCYLIAIPIGSLVSIVFRSIYCWLFIFDTVVAHISVVDYRTIEAVAIVCYR
jgi:hypothetical protein